MQSAWIIPASWWLRSALGGGLLLLAVWALMRLTRQPARRQRLGEWGLLAALLAAVLSAGPAWLALPGGVAFWRSSPRAAAPAPAAVPDDTAQADALTWADLPPDLALTAGDEAGQEAPPAAAPAPPPRPPWAAAWAVVSSWLSPDRLAAGLTAAYLLGAFFLTGRWLHGWLSLHRFLAGCTPAPGHAAALFADMTRHRKRPPRLLVSDRLPVPVSCGVWRPTVVLPAQFATPDHASRLRWVFAHELTHLERRDPWSCLLFGLGQGVYFYCPWFWWLRRQVRLCQEFVADAAAARLAGPAEDYAQFLVSLAEAPAGPRVAIGVVGHHSDLFRRITMLVQNPLRIESGCPRRWSLAALAGLFAVAVCTSGIGLRAADAEPDQPAPEAQAPAPPDEHALKPKKVIVVETVEGAKPSLVVVSSNADDLAELRKALDKLPPGPEMDKLKKDILKRLDELKAHPAAKANAPVAVQIQRNQLATSTLPGSTRLGVTISYVIPALREQLDLPKDKGILIAQVLPDRPAAKAGLKNNDVLLELDGKAVPSSGQEFLKLLNGTKAGTAVDAVVIRKGKKTTVKGITLPEGKDEVGGPKQGIRLVPNALPPGGAGGVPGAPGLPVPAARPILPRALPAPAIQPIAPVPAVPALPGAPPFVGPGATNAVMTSIVRTDDRFTGRYQEGSLIITVTGTVSEDKAKLKEIHVRDGQNTEKYESLSKVPERYRDKTKDLIDMAERGRVKVETRPGTRRGAKVDND